MPSLIRLHIDTLRVDDLGALSPQQLRDVVTSELARRFAETPPTEQPRSADRLDAGSFQLRTGLGAVGIGSAIAARVHGSLERACAPAPVPSSPTTDGAHDS